MKPDELWEKYYVNYGMVIHAIPKPAFQKALKKYVELVKAEAVKVCYDADKSTHPSDLAAAIEKMELP